MSTLDCWPALPITIWYDTDTPLSCEVEDDVLAGLKHSDRIHNIMLPISSSMLAKSTTSVWTFPELEHLSIMSPGPDGQFTVLPHTFLGGSTPTSKRLRRITLQSISFPTLPQLLMSSCDLAYLSLGPDVFTGEGFIPSDTLASSLSTATRLKTLYIYPPSELRHTLEQRSTHSRSSFPNLIVLPSLVDIEFDGSHEYLEDLVSRIHAPFLLDIAVHIYQKGAQPSYLPHLDQFLSQTECLRSLPLQTSIDIYDQFFVIKHDFGSSPQGCIALAVSFDDHEYWDMSQVDHFSRQLHPLISSVERVKIQLHVFPPSLQRKLHTHAMQWLQLFMLFNGAKDVQVYNINESYTGIALALQKSTEISQEVFPALRILRLCGFGEKMGWRIKYFVEGHRFTTGRTVIVLRRDKERCDSGGDEEFVF